MRLIKFGGLSLAAAATLAIGATPVMARPHGRPHKVCKTSWHNHHRVTKCRWERR